MSQPNNQINTILTIKGTPSPRVWSDSRMEEARQHMAGISSTTTDWILKGLGPFMMWESYACAGPQCKQGDKLAWMVFRKVCVWVASVWVCASVCLPEIFYLSLVNQQSPCHVGFVICVKSSAKRESSATEQQEETCGTDGKKKPSP